MERPIWDQQKVTGVWVGESSEPGPVVGIAGGIHGDETAGIIVVEGLKSNLKIDRGTVILIEGNLSAIEQQKRFTETNLNRSFRSLLDEEVGTGKLPYEVERAQELLPFLDQCESLLDLHEHHFRDSGPFIICEPNALDTAIAIGAPVISFGWSKSEPGGTDAYMYERGNEGICYELGYNQDQLPNASRGFEVVARYLSAKGLLDVSFEPLYKEPLFVQTEYAFTKRSNNFELAREFKSFEPLQAGELIARQDQEEVVANEGDIIIFPHQDPDIGTEAFTIGKQIDIN